MTMRKISERLKAARSAKGWTQADLARQSGVSRQTIAQVETDRNKKPEKLMELAKALEVSPGWLQFGIEGLDDVSKEALQAAIALDKLDEKQKRMIIAAINSAAED